MSDTKHVAEGEAVANEAAGANVSSAAVIETLTPPEPGAELANPAEPLAATKVPDRADASAYVAPGAVAPGFPRMKFHPVHGGVEIKTPDELAGLQPATDWFDTAEAADAARTWTEAHVAMTQNSRAKLGAHDEAGHTVVRNSVQADESVRRGLTEPL